MTKRFLTIGEAAEYLGVSKTSLRRWEKQGELVATYRTRGGHRRYSVAELNKILPCEERLVVGYCRVSAHDQKRDLERQKLRLKNVLKEESKNNIIISDLGSGLNYRKKGLQNLLRLIVNGQVKKLIITDNDRLLRFGAELIFQICDHFGTEVLVLNNEGKQESFEVTLAKDVITLMTVFTARLYGKRSRQNKRIVAA